MCCMCMCVCMCCMHVCACICVHVLCACMHVCVCARVCMLRGELAGHISERGCHGRGNKRGPFLRKSQRTSFYSWETEVSTAIFLKRAFDCIMASSPSSLEAKPPGGPWTHVAEWPPSPRLSVQVFRAAGPGAQQCASLCGFGEAHLPSPTRQAEPAQSAASLADNNGYGSKL